MNCKVFRSLLVLCILGLGYGAPAPTAEKRRESTPEILNLEQQLKLQAGEDKKFFPNPEAPPLPQIDGLDDNPPPIHLQLDADDVQKENEEEQEVNGDVITAEDDVSEEENDVTEEEEEEEEENLLEEEDERKAFVDGLMEALQENPDLLNQMMRDGGFDIGYEEDDLQGNDIKDMDDAIQAEMMSAMGLAGARPVPIDEDDVNMDNGVPGSDLESDLEQELEEEGEEEEEEEPFDLDEEEEEYYEELLKEIAMNRPDLLQESVQLYQGDPDASVVAKKRGYAPPPGYELAPPSVYDLDREPLASFGKEADKDNLVEAGSGDLPADIFSQGYRIPLQAENNVADELDELRSFWEGREPEKVVDRNARQAESRRWLYM